MIYELPKAHIEIPKYSEALVLTIIIYQGNSTPQVHLDLKYGLE